MRDVDSPAVCSWHGGLLRTLSNRRVNHYSRMFKYAAKYKEFEPMVYDGCQYREDSMDFEIVVPPLYR